MEYKTLRERMVGEQLIARGIKDQRVLEAFLKVERHKFVPEALRISAYADSPLAIGHDQTISQPYIVALMSECLKLTGDEKVLEVGTGSGYQTAILSRLAKEVCTIERIEALSQNAQSILADLGYANIKFSFGDGSLGWPKEAPFERIIITAASPQVPLPLIEQLKVSGRLIIPIGSGFGQTLTLIEKKKDRLETTQICGCVFVPLIGKHGYHSGTVL